MSSRRRTRILDFIFDKSRFRYRAWSRSRFFRRRRVCILRVRRSRIEVLAAPNKSAKRLLNLLIISALPRGFATRHNARCFGLGALGEPVSKRSRGRLNSFGLSRIRPHLRFPTERVRHYKRCLCTSFSRAGAEISVCTSGKVAMATALPMLIFYKIFKPFIHARDWASANIVNLFGLKVTSEHVRFTRKKKSRR